MSDVLSSPIRTAGLKNTLSLLDQLFPPPRKFAIRLWDGSELPSSGHPTFALILNHPGALKPRSTRPI